MGKQQQSRMRALIVFAAAVLLSACSSTVTRTKYGPMGLLGGYRDKQVGEHMWKVEGVSNGVTRVGFGEDTAVHRAAEVVQAAGFDYFYVVDQKISRRYVGYGRADNYAGETAVLKVKGVRSPTEPMSCEMEDTTKCLTLSVSDVLAKIGPRLNAVLPTEGDWREYQRYSTPQ